MAHSQFHFHSPAHRQSIQSYLFCAWSMPMRSTHCTTINLKPLFWINTFGLEKPSTGHLQDTHNYIGDHRIFSNRFMDIVFFIRSILIQTVRVSYSPHSSSNAQAMKPQWNLWGSLNVELDRRKSMTPSLHNRYLITVISRIIQESIWIISFAIYHYLSTILLKIEIIHGWYRYMFIFIHGMAWRTENLKWWTTPTPHATYDVICPSWMLLSSIFRNKSIELLQSFSIHRLSYIVNDWEWRAIYRDLVGRGEVEIVTTDQECPRDQNWVKIGKGFGNGLVVNFSRRLE